MGPGLSRVKDEFVLDKIHSGTKSTPNAFQMPPVSMTTLQLMLMVIPAHLTMMTNPVNVENMILTILILLPSVVLV